MSAVSSEATQQKFTNLRKRLDQLGYRQPLGIESLPLVERLFADLIHTTESLKESKLQQGKGGSDKVVVDAQIEPYKSDNAKLVKENNELHQQVIKQKEESDVAIRDLKASLRKLEHENADLQFLNNQYIHKVRAIERESKQKTDRILQLQEKNFHAVVQTPGGRKKNIPFRRQRMELDCTVPPPENPVFPYKTQADDPYVADLLKVTDSRMAQLEKEMKLVNEDKGILENKLKVFRQQVDNRDAEIDRLNGLLEGGRPFDVVALESRNRSNERLISHLNIQIDYLQQRNRELERKVDFADDKQREALNKSLELDVKNTNLEQELQTVDLMAKQLQTDKDLVVATADRELLSAKDDLQKSRQQLEDTSQMMTKLQLEHDRALTANNDLRIELSVSKAEQERLEALLDKMQEDKRRLSLRVNKLTANERELVIELERLRKRTGVVKKKSASKTPSQLESFIKGLEEDRDYWKGEVEALQIMLRSRPPSPVKSSPTRARSPLRKSANSSITSTPSKKERKAVSQYEAILRVLEDERDFYKRECEMAKAVSQRSASPVRSASPTRTPSKSVDIEELLQLRRERDELQNLLSKFERHMAEIQANVKVLTSERDKIGQMYEEAKEELQRMRHDAVRSPKTPKASLAAQAVLRRVENERDDVIADLRRMTTERDSLRERLKIATESHLSERARLEQRLEDMDINLRSLDDQKDELSVRSNSQHQTIEMLEDRVKSQALKISELTEEIAQHKAVATQMRLLSEQAERSLEEHQQRLTHKEGDLRAVGEKANRLENRVSELAKTGQTDREEISALRGTVNALDREKDSLQMTVDEKTERLAQLEDQIIAKDRNINELRIKGGELEVEIDRGNDVLNSREREIKSLRRQLDSTSEELTETSRGRDVVIRENRRLQDDLATMTRENQSLSNELQDVLEERDHLKNQVQDYITEVKRVEDTLASKEQERSDLLEQYRTLTLEAERYETQTHQLDSQASNLRLELMTRDSEVRRMKERIDQLTVDIQEHLGVEQSYEMQVSNLTQSVAQLEEKLRHSEDDRESTLQDLAAVRDLCARLELTKDALQQQMTGKTLDFEKVQTIADDREHEVEVLKSQLNAERQSVKNLEMLLQSNREKEFHTQLSSQERNAELQLLRDKVVLGDSKVESQSRELGTYRTRTIEMEGELDRIRRQLTNERFERERAVQELRRFGIAPPGESSGSRYTRVSTRTSPSPTRARTPDRSYLRSPDRARSPQNRSFRGNDTDELLNRSPSGKR